ncbi:MAG: Uma2 family endonuclease [Caldilineaceae bacterium]|nr:Uma2 family endonuclease [Caldilineaceae bacterium]HRJ42698.1 Uma2 family endonuclease [Caldilineaceae bacterium]
MSQEIITFIGEPEVYEIPRPDISHLVTEDDTPVDNIFSEKQMRLLASTLYSGWTGPSDGRPFVSMANVALYYALHTPALVPDFLLSLGVTPPAKPIDPETHSYPKENRSYFVWEYGKPPDLVVEIVSNRKGGELGDKLLDYARAGVGYYIVFDPMQALGREYLRIFTRHGNSFRETSERWFPEVDLGVTLWIGPWEEWPPQQWLRWVDKEGRLIPTSVEAQAAARQQVTAARQQVTAARQQVTAAQQESAEANRRAAEAQRQREELLAKLRAAGIDPDSI